MQGEIAKPKKSKVKWPSKDAAYAFTATENQKYGEKKRFKEYAHTAFYSQICHMLTNPYIKEAKECLYLFQKLHELTLPSLSMEHRHDDIW